MEIVNIKWCHQELFLIQVDVHNILSSAREAGSPAKSLSKRQTRPPWPLARYKVDYSKNMADKSLDISKIPKQSGLLLDQVSKYCTYSGQKKEKKRSYYVSVHMRLYKRKDGNA